MNGLRRQHGGFSLVELLVVVAIIGILASMYLATFAKVRRRAEQLVVQEGMRQEHIGRLADNANIARPSRPASGPGREECRQAYRQLLPTSTGEALYTELLYVVQTDAEFQAYWHTLLNPASTFTLEFSGGTLTAQDEDGNTFQLEPRGEPWDLSNRFGSIPIGWEFLSTRLDEMTGDGLTLIVVYSDGHVGRVQYPHEFPATPTVAELGHRYVAALP